MPDLHERIASFRGNVFPRQAALYRRLAQDGQQPQAMMISCADSRVMPETITQSDPGELFVCRNAGNIVPPYSDMNGGVSSAIEYAVKALKLRDIIICGHSECGAMQGLCCPHLIGDMPNVQTWLRHSHAARSVVSQLYGSDLDQPQRIRAVTLENVLVQLDNLRTHPTVAAALAGAEINLHGWFFDISSGGVLVYDGAKERFVEPGGDAPLPVAVAGRSRSRMPVVTVSAMAAE